VRFSSSPAARARSWFGPGPLWGLWLPPPGSSSVRLDLPLPAGIEVALPITAAIGITQARSMDRSQRLNTSKSFCLLEDDQRADREILVARIKNSACPRVAEASSPDIGPGIRGMKVVLETPTAFPGGHTAPPTI